MDHVMDLASEISESSSLVSEDLRTLDGSVDGEPRADGLYEERFRVDRRKLESMLLGKSNFFKIFERCQRWSRVLLYETWKQSLQGSLSSIAS